MIDLEDYPYAQVREALGTTLGRVALTATCALGGFFLGMVTAFGGLSAGFAALEVADAILVGYLLGGWGLIIVPLVLLFAFGFVRFELALKWCIPVLLLMWWSSHQTMRWNYFDSPAAKRMATFSQEVRDIINGAPDEQEEADNP
jgi:hypothetical protein